MSLVLDPLGALPASERYVSASAEPQNGLLTIHLRFAACVLALLATTLVAAAACWVAYRLLRPAMRVTAPGSIARRALLLAAVAPALFLGARSSLRHRPANPSSVASSSDPILNDLCPSSFYSVAYAASQMKGECDVASLYGSLPRQEEEIIADHDSRGHGASLVPIERFQIPAGPCCSTDKTKRAWRATKS